MGKMPPAFEKFIKGKKGKGKDKGKGGKMDKGKGKGKMPGFPTSEEQAAALRPKP